jgi:streptogramin lyase
MNNRIQTLLLSLVFVLLNACGTPKSGAENSVVNTSIYTPQVENNESMEDTNSDKCIPATHTFAYMTRTNDSILERSELIIPPTEPWEDMLSLPQFPNNAIAKRNKDWLVTVLNKSNSDYEIWILRSWTDELFSGSDFKFMEFLVYNSQNEEWKSVPVQVHETSAIVGEIFVTNDGNIWGRNYLAGFVSTIEPPLRIEIAYSQLQNDSMGETPLLSKYNERENRFEAADVSRSFLPSKFSNNEWDKVVLDKNGMFWIFVQADGLYSYNLLDQSIRLHIKFSDNDIPVRSVALAPDDSIFYSDNFSSVFRFIPKTGELLRVGGTPLPFENPYGLYFHNILIDNSGHLWLGNIGWAEPDTYTTWYQLMPSPVFITNNVEGLPIHQWERPWLILGSLDGLIWYKSSNGMVWVNPQKEKWCWFTTAQSNITEDQQHNLWLIAYGKLYKYTIKP